MMMVTNVSWSNQRADDNKGWWLSRLRQWCWGVCFGTCHYSDLYSEIYSNWLLNLLQLVQGWIVFCLNSCWHGFKTIYQVVSRDLSAAHPKGPLWDWDLMTGEAAQQTHCHVQQTILRWHGALQQLEVVIRKWVHCGERQLIHSWYW